MGEHVTANVVEGANVVVVGAAHAIEGAKCVAKPRLTRWRSAAASAGKKSDMLGLRECATASRAKPCNTRDAGSLRWADNMTRHCRSIMDANAGWPTMAGLHGQAGRRGACRGQRPTAAAATRSREAAWTATSVRRPSRAMAAEEATFITIVPSRWVISRRPRDTCGSLPTTSRSLPMIGSGHAQDPRWKVELGYKTNLRNV